MTTGPTVCLVSPAHLSNNPRLVKEADALAAAGFRVHVICGRYFSPIDRHDDAIRRHAAWSCTFVDYAPRLATRIENLLHKLARRRCAAAPRPSLAHAVRATHRAGPRLAAAAAAARQRAELYLGHLPAGLAAAAHAAQTHRARYGFDAEDFHAAETHAAMSDAGSRHALETLEAALLPGCAHFTAASPLIAEAYAAAVHVRTPRVILNVFPLREAPPAPSPPASRDEPPRLYWFSQTIGPGRGLEPLVAVLARMKTRCELHLRGLADPAFCADLQRRAAAASLAGRLQFHPLADAADMARLAHGHALGLSLEQTSPPNRDLCLTNKIFTYLLAGLPVALTPTRAQRALAADLGDAALLIDPQAPDEAARALDAFLSEPARRDRASAVAWRLARSRYNWDVEQEAFLASIRSALAA